MNAWQELLADRLLISTALLGAAAVAVQFLVWVLKPASISAQRFAWGCVLVQGVLLTRLSVAIPWFDHAQKADAPAVAPSVDQPPVAVLSRDNEPQRRAIAPPPVDDVPVPVASLPQADHMQLVQKTEPAPSQQPLWTWRKIATCAWAAGFFGLVAFAIAQYVRFIRRIRRTWPTQPAPAITDCPESIADAANLRDRSTTHRDADAGSVGHGHSNSEQPTDETNWQAEWNEIRSARNVARAIPLVVTRDLGPAVCWLPSGYKVVVPAALWSELDPSERKAILRHELAHYERGDLWKSLAAQLIAAAHWFNPLAWWALLRFETCGEWACDDRAARELGPTAFARTLMQLGGARLSPLPAPLTDSIVSRPLFGRIRRLLDPTSRPDSVLKRTLILGATVILLLAGAIRVEFVARTAAADKPTPQSSAPKEPATGAATKPDGADTAPPAALMLLLSGVDLPRSKGESPQTKPEPLQNRAAENERKPLLENLVKNQSLAALQRLLQLNKFDAAAVVRLGLDLRLARPNDPEQYRYRILVPRRLEFQKQELIIVPAIVVPAGSVVGPEPEFIEEKAAFIFDTEGTLQTAIRTGGCIAYRYDLSFTTLGTADSWFVVIDQPTKTSPPFTTHSEIFLVGPNLDLKKPVLSILHYGAGHIAWTGTPAQARYGGNTFAFYGPDRLPPERRPRIDWETKDGVFVGARRVEVDGVPVYEVDTAKSTKFREKSP